VNEYPPGPLKAVVRARIRATYGYGNGQLGARVGYTIGNSPRANGWDMLSGLQNGAVGGEVHYFAALDIPPVPLGTPLTFYLTGLHAGVDWELVDGMAQLMVELEPSLEL